MNRLSVNRTSALIIATVLLLVFAVAYHVWADWGLITIHAKNEPLGQVIASMQRQGHAKIQTNMTGDTPVTMDVVKVHLTDALETLSVVTDSRWQFLYFVADTKTAVKDAELSWFAGARPDGWTLVSFPVMGNMLVTDDDDPVAPPDPRYSVWTPKLAAPAAVQDFFTEAVALTDAGFAFPKDWNPTVNSTPHPGTVDRVIPKLIHSAGGREDELFFLSKNVRRGPPAAGGAGNGGGSPGGFGGGDFQMDPALLAEHVQAEINRLPPEQRADAQANFDAERAFRESLKDMTDEQRRAAWQQHMQDPRVQQMMMNRMDGRDAQMSTDQRMQRYQNMVTRKLTAMGKM